jgi:hypothetical protein
MNGVGLGVKNSVGHNLAFDRCCGSPAKVHDRHAKHEKQQIYNYEE